MIWLSSVGILTVVAVWIPHFSTSLPISAVVMEAPPEKLLPNDLDVLPNKAV
jgi:hypothetical protein